MVKKYMHENLKYTVIKHLVKKIMYSHFQTVTTNNSKHVSDFITNNTDSLMELLSNNTTCFPRHQADDSNIFRELLVNNTTHFSRVYIKQY